MKKSKFKSITFWLFKEKKKENLTAKKQTVQLVKFKKKFDDLIFNQSFFLKKSNIK